MMHTDRHEHAKKIATDNNLPLLFFVGKRSTPALFTPTNMTKDPKTVIISGSDAQFNQLKSTARSTLRAKIEKWRTRFSQLNNIKSFYMHDCDIQERYEVKNFLGHVKVGNPNKATQLYWALQDESVPWNPKSKNGIGSGKRLQALQELIPSPQLSPSDDQESKSQKKATKQQQRPLKPFGSRSQVIYGNFAQPLPQTSYAGVGFDAEGAFQPMSGDLREIFIAQHQRFASGSSYNVRNIPGRNLVYAEYVGNAPTPLQEAMAKIKRVETLKQLKLGDFAHFPVYVDLNTLDYYAARKDSDLNQAMLYSAKVQRMPTDQAAKAEAKKVRIQHWPPEQAAKGLGLFLSGVKDLHSKGWVHGDIKPQNILLEGTQPMLADWDTACPKEEISERVDDHDTAAYSQFRISDYGRKMEHLGSQQEYEQDGVNFTTEQIFKMTKCSDLIATVQSFYIAYQGSQLFENNPAVKKQMEDILDTKKLGHEREQLPHQRPARGFGLVFLSKAGDIIDKRYHPREVDQIYTRVLKEVKVLHTCLQNVRPGLAQQAGGDSKTVDPPPEQQARQASEFTKPKLEKFPQKDNFDLQETQEDNFDQQKTQENNFDLQATQEGNFYLQETQEDNFSLQTTKPPTLSRDNSGQSRPKTGQIGPKIGS